MNLTSHLLLSALLSLAACQNRQASSQPTAKPRAASWGGETSTRAGSLDGGCDIGGITALPGLSAWAYTEKRDVCLIRFLSTNKQKKNDLELGPIDDCGSISEVGALTLSTAGPAPFLYVLGSLSVSRVIDESGAMSFDGGTASRLFQVDPTGRSALKMLDTTETLRRAILEEFQRWNKELEASGMSIEREIKSLQVGGLAATPSGDFLLAFRSPRICPIDDADECRAILLLVSDLDGLFQKKPEVEIKARAMLSLDGDGVASLEYEPLSEGFLVTTTKASARLLRYKDALSSVRLRDISLSGESTLRAVVQAPGGAAAFFLGEKDSQSQCKLSWEPISIESLDGVDRTPPAE